MRHRVLGHDLDPLLLEKRDEVRVDLDAVGIDALRLQHLDQLAASAAEVDHTRLVAEQLDVLLLALTHRLLGPEARLEGLVVEVDRRAGRSLAVCGGSQRALPARAAVARGARAGGRAAASRSRPPHRRRAAREPARHGRSPRALRFLRRPTHSRAARRIPERRLRCKRGLESRHRRVGLSCEIVQHEEEQPHEELLDECDDRADDRLRRVAELRPETHARPAARQVEARAIPSGSPSAGAPRSSTPERSSPYAPAARSRATRSFSSVTSRSTSMICGEPFLSVTRARAPQVRSS